MDPARTPDPRTPPRRAKSAKQSARRVPNLRVVPSTATATVAVQLGAGDTPPTEFRLFVSGWNDTENGRFLFDEQAASATMAAYEKWGVDLAIDLEHQMLDPDIAPDPTAKDARGWCKLELRDDGSLWAVNVSWTADGAARLTEKRQRYISPAFGVDPETSRVTSILNVAITAIPATHDTPALMAARRSLPSDLRKLSTGPAFSDIQIAISAALTEMYPPADGADPFCDGPWVQDVFDATVVFQLKGAFYEATYTFDGSVATLGTPAEVVRSYAPAQAPAAPVAAAKKNVSKLSAGGSMDPKQVTEALDALVAGDAEKCMELLKGIVATAAGGVAPPAGEDKPKEEPKDGEPPPAAAAVVEKPEEVAAASARLMRLSGKSSFVDAIAETEVWRTSHLTLETETQKLAAERATFEMAERRKLCVELVSLGAEFPSTVWADDKSTALKPRWLKMDLTELKSHTAEQRSARGGKAAPAPVPPSTGGETADGGKEVTTPLGLVKLSAREIAMCAEMKIEPTAYAADKAARKKG